MTTDADADPVAAVAAPYIEHLNDEHGDWNVVLAKAFGGARDARRATVVGLDREGLDLEVDGDATRLVRVTFPAAITDESQLQRFGVELAREGRRLIGQDAPTRMERETAERATIRTFVTSVLRTEMVTRGVRQITFGGGDLATFEPLAADDFVYVLAPPPGRAALTVDASFTWEQFAAMAPAEQPVGAYYTVRRWRPTTAEMDVLFVLHGVGDEPAAGA
ncbi:MAG: siderophore-interacting protein, partial [Ilumatobacteraceae bacterium]